jgi:hypothetical protein
MSETEPKQNERIRPTWIMIGLAWTCFVVLAVALVFNYQKKFESSSNVKPGAESFPPVRAFVAVGLFTIPGCTRYNEEIGVQKPVILIPTVQEALLAGYRPIANCEAIQARLQKEKEQLGELHPSTNTDNWKIQRLLFRRMSQVDSDQSDVKSKQEELEQKQVETEQKQEETDDKLHNY